jgi:hypothetical protein
VGGGIHPFHNGGVPRKATHPSAALLNSLSLPFWTISTILIIMKDVHMDYSLPYVDNVHADYEEYALALVEEEMKQFTPRALDRDMPSLQCRTTLMKHEYDTLVVRGDNMQDDDDDKEGSFVPRTMTLAELDTRLPPKHPASENGSDYDAWKNQTLAYARAKYEAERIRSIVLEAEKHASMAGGIWKRYNDNTLTPLSETWVTAVQQQREAVDEINFQRQQSQEQQFGPQLDQYTLHYQQALYKRNQLEHAIWSLERQPPPNEQQD